MPVEQGFVPLRLAVCLQYIREYIEDNNEDNNMKITINEYPG